MQTRFEQFIRERKYVTNVSEKTLIWYRQAFKHLGTPDPSGPELKEFVIRLRERGLKPSSVNAYGRAVNAYLNWSGSSHRIPRLKEPQLTLSVYKADDIKKFIRWKPKRACDVRLHVLVLLLVDCGLRISEALGLHWSDVDFDNLLLTVHGKGAKDRTIPFSFELRKHLIRYQQDERGLVLGTRCGLGLDIDNVRRDVKLLCTRLGFAAPARTLHAFRHTFAVNYLRRGGSVFHLQKVLGHSTLDMTRRYANLMTEDLQRVHQRLSLLAA